jgi:3-oxoacyl-[acyl-carrier protein] reductase
MSDPNTSPNRIALVTGGSRGIGRAISIALAASSHDIALTYASNQAEAAITERLCLEAAQAKGHQIRVESFGGDVANTENCEAIFQNVVEALGTPDILVNNAGITRDGLILKMSVDDFDAVINVNLRAAFIFSKLASRGMVRQHFGRIINISSVVGLAGNAGQANYAASKAGLVGLTRALAKELGSRQITVNAIAPGFIETSMTDALSEATRENLIKSLSIPRLGTPEDVAALAAFLASDAAAYITGQVICVDGGLVI